MNKRVIDDNEIAIYVRALRKNLVNSIDTTSVEQNSLGKSSLPRINVSRNPNVAHL